MKRVNIMAKAQASNKTATKPADNTVTGTAVVEATSAIAQTFASAQAQLAAKLPGFKVKKQLTMPVMKVVENELYAIKILDAIRVSTYKNEKDEKPADLCGVIDLHTGSMHTFLTPAVFKKNIEEMYPEAGYVGKSFAIQKLPRRPGKRYNDYNIAEIEEE